MTTIKLKRSATSGSVPSASDLEQGEVAINTADGRLFVKHTDNSIVEIEGTKGEKGQTGSQGDQGAKGQKGQTGDQGLAGSDGSAGDKGQKGEVGATGSSGADGSDGSKGQKGQKGDDGVDGSSGSDGAKGEKGQKGEVGAAGSDGATGAKGQKGEVGNDGAAGSDGAKGQKGEVGDKGQKGEVGSDGSDGSKGQKGEVGQKGQQGNFGGQTFSYQFNTTTTDSDPTSGKLLFDNATPSSATRINIDDQDAGATDIQSFLRTIDDSTSTIKGHVRISNSTDANDFVIYTISSLVENTGYFRLVVSYIDGDATFANNESLTVTFARTGDVGDKGQKGEAGTIGVDGDKGQKGEVGAAGSNGSDGAKGQKGEVGAAGSDGSNGSDGAKGQKGEVGATGSAGSNGAKGEKGQKGQTGSAGSDGSDGSKGEKGQKGEVGAAGTNGTDGTKGQKGEKGQKGQTGSTGATGAKGQKGEVGATGSTGSTGSKGQKGQKGEKGQKGQTGNTGSTGSTGSKGQKGQKGEPTTVNYSDTRNWTESSGSQSGYGLGGTFNQNGDGNSCVYALDPYGRRALVWRTLNNDTTSDADGGWNQDFSGISDNKSYMSVVFVKRVGSSTNGSFYHGCHGSHTLNLNGTANGNPYFSSFGISTLPQDVWCVSIGIIQSNDDTNTSNVAAGGLYRLDTGAKITSYTTFKMKNGSTSQRHRTYLYYSTSPSSQLQWWGAGFYEINGNEPNLDVLTGGLKGQKGATGSTGSTGSTGAKGQKGEKGQKGQTGSTGSTGAKGQKGQTGSTGSTGSKGQKGEVGPSAVTSTSVTIGSGVVLQESTDRADLLQITSSTSSWGGLQIRNSSNEGRWSFMTDGGAAGIYDDENGDWHIYMVENGAVQLRHNSVEQLETASGGVAVRGLNVGSHNNGNPHNANGIQVNMSTDEKIVLSGSNNPYIRWQEGTTDRAYIQWSSDDALLFKNQQADNFDFMTHDTTGAINLRLRGSDGDTFGSVYAYNNSDVGQIGFLDDDQSWAYIITGDVSHQWLINNSLKLRLDSSSLELDCGTSSTLNVKCDDAGLAMIRANGDGQGTGAVEVGQSNTYGGGIYYNGDNSPSFASGESSDTIGFYRMSAGTRTEVFYYPHNSNNVFFNGTGYFPTIYLNGSIVHNGDTNTYLEFHASDQWRVVTGGGERLEVNSTNTTVQNNLIVNGTATFNGTVSGITASARNGYFWENDQTITSNQTITNNKNAMSAGPITINNNVTVTIGDGEAWSIV